MPGVSSKTALLCLERTGSDGTGTPNVTIDAFDDIEDRVLPLESLIAIARQSGFRLRSATFDWRALLAASTTKTVLLVLRNANVVLVLGGGRQGLDEVAVSDPLYKNGEPFFLPRSDLEHAWGGEALIFKPKRSSADRTLTWGFSVLSICGLAAGLLLVSQTAIDGTLAGTHPFHPATSAAASSSPSVSPPASNDGQSNAAAAANVDVRMNASEGVKPGALTSLTASPEIREAAPGAEAPQTEQSPIAAQQAPEARTAPAARNVEEPLPESEQSGEKSAQSPPGELPQTLTSTGAVPAAPADTGSAQAAGLSLSTDEVGALLARGDSLVVKGDIASARLFYERAAEAADGQAALRLAESYDPAFLARAHLSGARGDPLAAARWYRRARELGISDAEILLQTLAPGKNQ